MLAHRLNVSQPKTFSEHITQHLISNEKIKTPPIQKDATFMIMSLSIQESGTTPNHLAWLINSQDPFANKWQVINQTTCQTFQRCYFFRCTSTTINLILISYWNLNSARMCGELVEDYCTQAATYWGGSPILKSTTAIKSDPIQACQSFCESATIPDKWIGTGSTCCAWYPEGNVCTLYSGPSGKFMGNKGTQGSYYRAVRCTLGKIWKNTSERWPLYSFITDINFDNLL